MPNLITAQKTYKTYANAQIALMNALERAGTSLARERWLIACNEDGRFVPVLVGMQYIPFAHVGVMVVS
jgi:hypothetical protein